MLIRLHTPCTRRALEVILKPIILLLVLGAQVAMESQKTSTVLCATVARKLLPVALCQGRIQVTIANEVI